MNSINGKILIFTDLHCGLAGNKESRLKICREVVSNIVSAVHDLEISAVIFGGDWFHQRASIDGNTINVALKLIDELQAACPVYMCVGNHDAYFKNTVDVNSVNMFRSMPNICIVDQPTTVSVNGRACLLAPWLTDFSVFGKNQFDMAVGHFDISSKYLTQQYILEHRAAETADSDIMAELGFNQECEPVGDFVEIVKPGGVIFAGHIHNRREFVTKGRRFVFVGSPYQQNFGEMGCECGFYVVDVDGNYRFVPITTTPKHVKIPMSEAISGKFDFSLVRNAIVQRVYDIDVNRADETTVQLKIEEHSPYEEVVPEYTVKPSSETASDDSSFSVAAIRKSKLDYIRGYIDSIDENALAEKNIDREKLFGILKTYYENVVGEI